MKNALENPSLEQPGDLPQAEQLAELDRLTTEAANEDFIPEPETVAAEGQYQAAPEIGTGQMVTALLSIGFNMVAGRKGQHWQLSPEEATETGEAIGAVLDKYFPDLSGSGVELTACMTVAMVLTPRLMQDKAIEAEIANREKLDREGGEDGS